MITLSRQRWLMSFADLTLLLLAFFVLLHAQVNGPAATASVRQAFGGSPGTTPSSQILAAGELFVPGEAVLRGGAAERLRAIGARAHGGRIRVTSRGSDTPGLRLDAWELTAARLAAIARGLAAGGLPQRAIDLDLPDTTARTGPQRFELILRRR